MFAALNPADVSAEPDWQLVNTFAPGIGHSPHYRYHGAITQGQMLAACWRIASFTPAARRESALRLLALWQRKTGYRAARPYVDAVMELAVDRAEDGEVPIDLRDLPAVAVRLE